MDQDKMLLVPLEDQEVEDQVVQTLLQLEVQVQHAKEMMVELDMVLLQVLPLPVVVEEIHLQELMLQVQVMLEQAEQEQILILLFQDL